MENLHGHEAGNGGYCQGDTYCNSPFLDPTLNFNPIHIIDIMMKVSMFKPYILRITKYNL
jgi:hypothetical protein